MKTNGIFSLLSILYFTTILLPNSAEARLPSLVGFHDMQIQTRCTTPETTSDQPNAITPLLPVIDANGITINFETGGLPQTLNLFSSHPHLIKLPSAVEIGDGEANQIFVEIAAVKEPTLVFIRAKLEGSLLAGFDDVDAIMVYPRFEIDEVTIHPEKSVYQIGDVVTVELSTSYPFPDLSLEPFGTQPKTGTEIDPVYMVGEDWQRYLNGGPYWELTPSRQGFSYSFVVRWPQAEAYQNLRDYSANFSFSVGYVRPSFCSFFRSYSEDININVRNPYFSIKPALEITPYKPIFTHEK